MPEPKGLTVEEGRSLAKYLGFVASDEVMEHFIETWRKISTRRSAGAQPEELDFKLDDELSLAAEELVRRGVRTHDELEQMTLGKRS